MTTVIGSVGECLPYVECQHPLATANGSVLRPFNRLLRQCVERRSWVLSARIRWLPQTVLCCVAISAVWLSADFDVECKHPLATANGSVLSDLPVARSPRLPVFLISIWVHFG